jgi:hypothetical protein
MHFEGIEEHSTLAIIAVGVVGLAALVAAVPVLRRSQATALTP